MIERFNLFFLTIFITALVLSFNLITPQALADEGVEEPDRYVKIRLMPESNRVEAGQEIWIGIEKSIYTHWHTYWTNAGDSGTALNADWSLPDGFEIDTIQFPYPKLLPYGPLMNYGYEGNTVLLQKLRVPDTLPEGPIALSVDIDLLVCKEICIPEYSSHSIILNDASVPQDDNRVYIEAAQNKLPQIVAWDTAYSHNGEQFIVTLSPDNNEIFDQIDTLRFYPVDWGLVDNVAEQTIAVDGDKIIITQDAGDRMASEVAMLDGVLVVDQSFAYQFKAPYDPSLPLPSIAQESGDHAHSHHDHGMMDHSVDIDGMSVLQAILFALVGGLILNLMPCVFPVLSIKALSLSKMKDKEAGKAMMSGIAYTLGVVISFVVIAGILIALQSAGSQIGWGFQLQNPVVIAVLVYLFFLIGLNLAGFFDISSRAANVGQGFTQGDGFIPSFFTGTLATLVATPCTAPFMAGAIGFAATQPPVVSLSIFAALGFGLALPYLVVSFVPTARHAMPKPGAWMDTFKQFLSFPMFASAAWLFWVLTQQAGSSSLFMVLIGLVLIAFGLWLLRYQGGLSKILAFLSFGVALWAAVMAGPDKVEMKFGEPFDPATLSEALVGDDPVFVEMTAAWCVTCKYNNAVAIDIPSTRDLFSEYDVQFYIGDWTNEDSVITEYLQAYGRNGVPLYVYYGPRDPETGEHPDEVLLPQILTPGIVSDAIKGL